MIERAIHPDELNILSGMESAPLGQEIRIVRAGWGSHISTENMLLRWAPESTLTKQQGIKDYGFSGGYFFGEEFVSTTKEAFDVHADRISALVGEAMRWRKWDHANVFVATVSAPPTIGHRIRENLKNLGLTADTLVFYGLACDGFGGSLLDSLAQSEFLGQPTVYVAAETLTGSPVPRKNIEMSALFGNGGAALAIIPGKEVRLVHPDLLAAVVRKDEKNVIQFPRVYDVQDYEPQRKALPPWYTIDPNAKESFLFGEDVVINTMTTQEGDLGRLANMNGKVTGVEFSNLIIHLAGDMIDRFRNLYPGEELTSGLFHQPSEVIWKHVAKKLSEKYPSLSIPWFMKDTGFNNTSSATLPIAMVQAALEHRIRPGVPILIGTFGVGLSGHAGVIRFNF